MAWIKVRSDLHENPHVIRLATHLDIPRLHALGLLCRFWSWADSQTTDGVGCLQGLKVDEVDAIVAHSGFSAAMESVGWLEITPSGISIPEFDNHMSESAKKRAINARRMAVSRSKCTNRAQKTHQRREEKRREEKKQPKQKPLDLAGKDFVSATNGPVPNTFLAAWADWVAHRKEIRKPLTERGAKAALKKCKGFGYDAAIKALGNSVAGGHQGLYDPGGRGSAGQPTRLGRCEAPTGKYPD